MASDVPTIAGVALSHSPQMGEDFDRVQGLTFRQSYERLARAVADYDPTVVVFFGPDHLRALTGFAPCFTVVESATGYGDWGTPQEDYSVPSELAVALGQHLTSQGIDIAFAPHLRLDHGFGQSTADIFGSLSAVPVIPVIVNCVDRPIPLAARCAALGESVNDFLRSMLGAQDRVLVIGSGGLSHQPPSLIPGARTLSEAERRALIAAAGDRAADPMNPEWDNEFLQRLASSKWEALRDLHPEDIAPGGAGGFEILTWISAAFAAGGPLATVVYEPVREWITGMGIAVSPHLVLS
jgi:2,3-dihydroxyphenylpropionate 1,2-dioxygenase